MLERFDRLGCHRAHIAAFIPCLMLLAGFSLGTAHADQSAQSGNGAFKELSAALQPWTGDYSGMVERRMIRILVPYSSTHYFLDGATERGVVAASGRELEAEVNRKEGRRTNLVHVIFIPTPRHELLARLQEGIGDIAAGSIVVTPGRKELVDFSEPVFRHAKEIVCTGPSAPPLNRIEDLAGQVVHVQSSSSYHKSLTRLNDAFARQGLAPIRIEKLDDRLETDEILELVQSGVIPMTVATDFLANFWAQMFSGLEARSDLVVQDNRDIGWAFRKDSPELADVLNEFITPRRHRTKFGNIMFRRYLQNTSWVENPGATADRSRYEQLRPLFDRYGSEYQLDPTFMLALGYQESRLDHSVRSPVGAIGVMQLMPTTGNSLGVGDITQLEPNIHAGARYLRQLIDLFDEDGVRQLDQYMMAMAAYNGGQTRIRRLRRQAAESGLDPDTWFDNVELISARVIGRENVQYVRNIYKYYLAFRLIEQLRAERAQRLPTPASD